MSDRANINHEIIVWARKSAKISQETAASKLKITTNKIVEWESGTSQPTIKQAQKLAKIYRRPFALFFLPEKPDDFQPLQDFRKKGSNVLGTASLFIIREIQERQSWLRECSEENGDTVLDFVGKYSLSDNPITVANDILATVYIDPSRYASHNPLSEWIQKAEEKGIFISRTSFVHSRMKLDADEIQGFAIADPYAPFIFINTVDWKSAQLFTLVHELAHIWINETGISSEIDVENYRHNLYHPVELFCNEVAANALIPYDFIKNIDNNVFHQADALFKTAQKIGVSTFSLLFRAYTLDMISFSSYKKMKNEATIALHDFITKDKERKKKQKEQPGGPNPYLLRILKNSRLFTQIVLDGFYSGGIAPTQASQLLQTPVNKFSLLEAQLYR